MSTRRPPSREDFHLFFSGRLQRLTSRRELVWLSNVLPVEALAAAYPLGVFPWPGEDPELFPWVCPRIRGVLPLDKFHLGRSTRRQLRRAGFDITFDRAFPEIMQACHQAHLTQSWIHPRMREAYLQAHQQGFAHSVEVWRDGELAGGLYGVDSGGFFSGESMFHRVPNAGKAAIAFLVDQRKNLGNRFLDIQQLTPHMRAMGAENWTRERFLNEAGIGYSVRR